MLADAAAVVPVQHQAGPLFACNYVTGQRILNALTEAMGSAPFKSAWQEIQRGADTDTPATDKVIYETFRRHTPSGRLTLFEAAYAIWHTGNFD